MIEHLMPGSFPRRHSPKAGAIVKTAPFSSPRLLLASGITGYCVRVILGRLYNHLEPNPAEKSKDHVWAMYKNEEGTWQILEPQIFHSDLPGSPAEIDTDARPDYRLEYIPYYALNDSHLWYIFNRDEEENLRGGRREPDQLL